MEVAIDEIKGAKMLVVIAEHDEIAGGNELGRVNRTGFKRRPKAFVGHIPPKQGLIAAFEVELRAFGTSEEPPHVGRLGAADGMAVARPDLHGVVGQVSGDIRSRNTSLDLP
jgi:hypothetical protein